VKEFQSDQGPPIFLISLKAGGYGLTLTRADTVIHFDPWWNPAVENQATDRAHRIGQKNPVTAYKLITTGTIEERILSLQNKKRNIIETALEDESPMMSGLNENDIREILA
jgi:SNF2 family DNA or RNA helicase